MVTRNLGPGLRAVIFDWAGTLIDWGSCAPVDAFMAVFAQEGVSVTAAEARAPMGAAKRDHLRAMSVMPRIAQAWQQTHGQPCSESDIDRMYAAFLPLQMDAIDQRRDLIRGAREAVDACRRRGLKIATTTGYSRTLTERVLHHAAQQGLIPDVSICADDVTQGRPEPDMIQRALAQLNITDPGAALVLDDTTTGIQAGARAGCRVVAVTDSGNLMGLNAEDYAQLASDQLAQRRASAIADLTHAGAHRTLPSVLELPTIIESSLDLPAIAHAAVERSAS